MQKFSLKLIIFFVSFFILSFGVDKALAAPFITSASPASIISGTAFTLTINGSGFDKTSVITLGGQQKITDTTGTPFQLSTQILASDIPGTGFILVGVLSGSCNCSSNFVSIPVTSNTGYLTIKKESTGGTGSEVFSYTVSGPSGSFPVSVQTFGTSNLAQGSSGQRGPLSAGNYTILEDSMTNWNLGLVSCFNTVTGGSIGSLVTNGITITIGNGINAICTFSNNYGTIAPPPVIPPPPTTGSITVNKTITNYTGNGQTFGFTASSLHVLPTQFCQVTLSSSNTSGSCLLSNLQTGYSWHITETPVANWSSTPTGGCQASVGGVCNFTNNYTGGGIGNGSGSITITKNTTPGSGDGTFTFTGTNGAGNYTLTTVGGTRSQYIPFVSTGTYIISESNANQNGWTLTGPPSCVVNGSGLANFTYTANSATINIGNNSTNVTCTFTNAYNTPTQPPSCSALDNDPGSMVYYRGSQNNVYYFKLIGTNNGIGWGGGTGTILSAGGTPIAVQSPYTDDSDLSTMTVHSGAIDVGENAVVKVTLLPGEPSYIGNTQNGITTLSYGSWPASYEVELEEVCSPPPSGNGNLVIVKNTSGGIGNETFNFDITRPGSPTISRSVTTSGSTFSASGSTNPSIQLAPANDYGITEVGPNGPSGQNGWVLTNAFCTIGNQVLPTGTVEIVAGQTTTCTFTNVFQSTATGTGALVVTKNTFDINENDIFNFSGNVSANPFTLQTVNGVKSKVFLFLTPGSYTVNETLTASQIAAGWQMISNGCQSVSIAVGDIKTCEITNTKTAPTTTTLRVNKVLIPSTDTGKFNLRIDGATAGTGANVGNGGTTGAVTVIAGSHTVSETAGAGTTLSNYTSVISGDCASNGNITLATGDNKVCTITNTLNGTPPPPPPPAGTIVIRKETSGGTGIETFNFNMINNSTGAVSISTSILANQTQSGTYNHYGQTGNIYPAIGTSYSIIETNANQFGWTLDSVSCSPVAGTPATNGINISINSEQSTTCTFRNSHPPGTAQLKVIKLLQPSSVQSTFHIKVDGTPIKPSVAYTTDPYEFLNGSQSNYVTVTSGPHQLTESLVDYSPFASPPVSSINDFDPTFSCSGGVTINNQGNFNLTAGQQTTCVITNKYSPKFTSIEVKKITTGGDDTFDFTASATPLAPINFSITTTNGSGNHTIPNAPFGTWKITEDLGSLPDWSLTNASCETNGNPIGNNVSLGVESISITTNSPVNCQFENDYSPTTGDIEVTKTTTGGDDTFEFIATASPFAPIDFQITTIGGTGTYLLDNLDSSAMWKIIEDPTLMPVDWSFDTATCDIAGSSTGTQITDGIKDVEVQISVTTECEFTNIYSPATLEVQKILIPSTDTGTFNLQINSITEGTGADVGDGGTTGPIALNPGNYIVGEQPGIGTDLLDYSTEIGGDCDPFGNVILGSGEQKICTITNTRASGIEVKKISNGGDKIFGFIATSPPLAPIPFYIATTSGQGTYILENAFSGIWQIEEQAIPAGWTQVSNGCSSVTVLPGELATCQIVNNCNSGSCYSSGETYGQKEVPPT